jgi:hypothetical protein
LLPLFALAQADFVPIFVGFTRFFFFFYANLVLGLPDFDLAQTKCFWKACDASFLKLRTLKFLVLDLANYKYIIKRRTELTF